MIENHPDVNKYATRLKFLREQNVITEHQWFDTISKIIDVGAKDKKFNKEEFLFHCGFQ